MADAPLTLCFGVHNHQPIGQLDAVLEETTARAYHPFLERVRARPELRLTMHCTGSLLEWLRARAPRTFDLLGEAAAAGQVELLTGGFYEPILAVLPDADQLGQIQRLTGYLVSAFGVRPRGMWLAERVWEPHLPRVLAAAGVEYVLVDDTHFALAGLDPHALSGSYLTEHQGARVRVLPISQRLRYLIPWKPVEDCLAYLESRRGEASVLTVVDDGEKFGAWPGTHLLVHEDEWLDRFFDGVLATPWLRMATLAEAVDATAPAGRVYLPTASYREMGEWALPVEAAHALAGARRALTAVDGGAAIADLLRGGFWRGFLAKYPEIADTYWKMLGLSAALAAAGRRRRGKGALTSARTALWRGQANDAYWHGVFGGCYLPHLRRAVKSALLEAERGLAEADPRPAAAAWRGDANGDGREEIVLRTPALTVTLNPAAGGSITEIGFLPRALDLADVLARRPEAYHALGGVEGAAFAYDDTRRASLLDALLPETGVVDAVSPWATARLRFDGPQSVVSLEAAADAAQVLLVPADRVEGLALEKRVTVRGSEVEARYAVRGAGEGRWGVQWNLALTAGDAPGRYLRWAGPTPPAGWPGLGSTGQRHASGEIDLVDEWIGVRARLTLDPPGDVAWGPVETLSASEAGVERIYQGTALLVSWPLADGGERRLRVALAVEAL